MNSSQTSVYQPNICTHLPYTICVCVCTCNYKGIPQFTCAQFTHFSQKHLLLTHYHLHTYAVCLFSNTGQENEQKGDKLPEERTAPTTSEITFY